MAIVQTINFSSFCDAFVRQHRADNFSYDAKKAIFDYLEELSNNDGNNFELDIIAICCEYTEMQAEDVLDGYPALVFSHELQEEDEDQEDYIERLNDEVQEYLEDNTTVLLSDKGNFVFVQF